jgi:hypothetical protein
MNLTAGQTARQQTSGSYFMLLDTGAAASVDLIIRVHQQSAEHISTAKRGTKAKLQGGMTFDSVEMTATVNCVVQFIVSDGLVDFDIIDGATVQVGNSLAIPVSNDRGSPGNPIFVNSSIAGLPAAVAIVNDAPVAITAAFSAIVAANANRVSLRLTNKGANVVALGGAGLTFANGAVLLQPGDTWIEERAANLAWGGICDVTLSSSIGVQEITA